MRPDGLILTKQLLGRRGGIGKIKELDDNFVLETVRYTNDSEGYSKANWHIYLHDFKGNIIWEREPGKELYGERFWFNSSEYFFVLCDRTRKVVALNKNTGEAISLIQFDFEERIGSSIIDFFLGSGTTSSVAHKMGRKWLGIEMGEQFNTIILPRMKKVLAGDNIGISKDINWKGGGFFKYYSLEQFEDSLSKVNYSENVPFSNNNENIASEYIFKNDLKLLNVLTINESTENVNINLNNNMHFDQ